MPDIVCGMSKPMYNIPHTTYKKWNILFALPPPVLLYQGKHERLAYTDCSEERLNETDAFALFTHSPLCHANLYRSARS